MTVRKLCTVAMGIALFVVLSLCLQVPVFENYYLCLGYVVMTVFCFYFGPLSGMAVGTLGVVLYCLLISGLRGMPGWAAANLVIGAAVGVACKFTQNMKNQLLRHTLLAVVIILSSAIGVLGLKSLVEVILYAQPMLLRMAKNIYAFVADAVVMVVSLPVCAGLKKAIPTLSPGSSGANGA